MLVEIGLVHTGGYTVEVSEQIRLRAGLLIALLARLPEQIVDQYLGMNFFLDIKRRRVDDEVAPILLIFPTPDELRIEVGVARIFYRLGLFLLFLKNGLVLGRRDVFALGLVVCQRFDRLCRRLKLRFLYHVNFLVGSYPANEPIILLN